MKRAAIKIDLIEVEANPTHIRYLFERLNGRDLAQTISHDSETSYQEHEQFVKNHPYRRWFIVSVNNRFIGTTYLHQDNSIGIDFERSQHDKIASVLDVICSKYEPLPAVKSVRNGKFHLNVASRNLTLRSTVEKLGATHIQSTYLLP